MAQGRALMQHILDLRAFSLLSMRRKQINQRGSPARAAAMWCMVEEIRNGCEGRWNHNEITDDRPFRDVLTSIIGNLYFYCCIYIRTILAAIPVADSRFRVHHVKPIMSKNSLWYEYRENRHHVGCLLEIQTVGCFTDDLDLASIWWPLTSSMISRTMSVSSSLF